MARPTDTPPAEPWERQSDETARQHARFTVYLNLGPYRTLTSAHKALTENGDRIGYSSLRQLSSTHRWTPRAAQWDAKQDREDYARLTAARRAMIDRQLSVAETLFERATDALAASDALGPADVVRMIKLASDIQWRALNIPTIAVEISGRDGGPIQTEDISRLTADERRARLREVVGEMARRAGLTVAPAGEDDEDDED